MPDFLTDPHSYLRVCRNSGLPLGTFPRRRNNRRFVLMCALILASLLMLAAGWPT